MLSGAGEESVAGVDTLWRAYAATGDLAARDRLILHFSPLVKFVVGRLYAGLPSSVDQGDLLSDGLVGLMDAVSKFDVERGLQFQTYAVSRIRGAIIDGQRAQDWVPRQVRAKLRDISVVQASLEFSLGRAPSDHEVAGALGVTVEQLFALYSEASYTQVLSMDTTAWSGDVSGPRADIGGTDGDVPSGFRSAVRQLAERDQIVIALYYWERLTLEEIAQVLGVTESRISQLHGRAIIRLRTALSAPAH